VKVLIADDDPDQCDGLQGHLRRWGYDVIATRDGVSAWHAMQEESPLLAILDWMMPGLSGPEVCRKARELPSAKTPYLLLLTARADRTDILAGLEAGADDYVTKPFSGDELRARVQIGMRILTLRQSLTDRVRELESALARVTQLEGLLPICMYCKKIRDDHNSWQRLEAYFGSHSKARFSHGICPDCYAEKVVGCETKN
jgi:phosphoserine phosphatase RsbU/P